MRLTLIYAIFLGAAALNGCTASFAVNADDREAPLVKPSKRTGGPVGTKPVDVAQRQGQTFTGKVQSFNVGRRGEIEGFMLLVDGKLAQMNLPPGIGAAVAANVQLGESITASVQEQQEMSRPGMGPIGPMNRGPGDDLRRPGAEGPRPRMNRPGERGPGREPRMDRGPDRARDDRSPPREGWPDQAMTKPAHPVYLAISVTDSKGKIYGIARPADRKAIHVESNVKSLNYDRAGQVNGAQLASGEFVHMSPQAARTMDLKVGANLKIDGVVEPTIAGGKAIDAHTINGIAVKEIEGEAREGRPLAPRGEMDREIQREGGPGMRGDLPPGRRTEGRPEEKRPKARPVDRDDDDHDENQKHEDR